jgi:hypothetical protein
VCKVKHLRDGAERQQALWRFWQEIYRKPTTPGQDDYHSLRGHRLAEYVALVDEQRREEGRELFMVQQYITTSLPPYVIMWNPRQGDKGDGVALLQD